MNNIYRSFHLIVACYILIGCTKFARLDKECGLRAAAECYKLTSACIQSDTRTKIQASSSSPEKKASISQGEE
jgi:hypothetical protein